MDLWPARTQCRAPPPRAPCGTAPRCRGLPGRHLPSHVQLPRCSHAWMKRPGSSGVELVPGLLGKPNPCPQGEASLQRLQKAPSPHGPGTQRHGPVPCRKSRGLCPSVLFWSLEEGFNAWLAVKAWPPLLR